MKTFTFTAAWPRRPRQSRCNLKRGIVLADSEHAAIAIVSKHPLCSGAEKIAVAEFLGPIEIIQAG